MRRLLGAALLTFFLGSCQDSADLSEAASKPVILNADEYRKEISEIDRLVFAPGPFLDERSNALTARLEELASRVNAVSDSKFLALEALEIRRLEARARNFRSDGQAEMSHQWMRIRNNLFDDRSWFARSAADLQPR